MPHSLNLRHSFLQIKSRKLHELSASAVPSKYQAELARLKIKSAGKQ
jgi:hypothetical protein